MKPILFVLTLALALPSTAFAGQCQDDLALIDKALAERDLAPDERDQIEDMRNQAVQLCGAGNEQEGIDVLSEAKAMLDLD
ncbi:MAG: hypothetical protein KDK89_17080 [Alphaproteobacteria bacterium]|nr:hypothetical protein [Alphaproteobacteria bacterium]